MLSTVFCNLKVVLSKCSKIMLSIIVIFCLVNKGLSAHSGIDQWADKLIRDVKETLKSKDLDFIPIPELYEESVFHVGKHAVKYGMHATRGVFGEISTLKRFNNVSTFLTNDGLVIKLTIAFENAGAHFDYCSMWYGTSQTTNELDLKVPKYKSGFVFVGVKVNLKENFSMLLDYVKVSDFEDLVVIFDELNVSKQAEVKYWVTTFLNERVKTMVENILILVLNEELELNYIPDVIK